MYKKFILLSSLILMSGLVATQAQVIADGIPTGIKVYVVGADSSYDVYGGDIAPTDDDSVYEIGFHPEENGYDFLGSANSTHEFYGSYFYYLVESSSGTVQVDAFEFLGFSDCFWDPIGCNGPDDPLWYSSNFWDPPCEEGPTIGYCPQNCQGPPDGEYSCLYGYSLMSGMVCEEPLVIVPYVIGMTESDAEDTLQANFLVKGIVTYEYDNTVPEGHVISQMPSDGMLVERGSTVDLVISKGPIFPDLKAEFIDIGFRYPSDSGADFQAEVKLLITNIGETTTQLGQVIDMAFFLRPIDALDGSDDIFVYTFNNILIDRLEPGRSRKVGLSVPIYIPSFTYGTYRLGVYIDSSNDVLESDEGNNVILSNAIISIHLGIPVWIPDLTGEISKISFRNSPSPGVEGRVVIDVDNVGTGQTASKQVMNIEICLRPCDATDDTDDITLLTLEDQSISKLAPGRSKTFRATFNLPSDLETGEYLLVAKIDSSDVVEELKEDNNEAISECFIVE